MALSKKKQNIIISESTRAVFEHTQDIMFIKNIDFVYVCASKAFAELVGISDPSLVAGKTDFDLFANEALALRYRDDDERLLNSGEPLVEYIEPIPSKNGVTRYSKSCKYIIKDNRGEAIGIYGVGRDITWEYKAKTNYDRELRYLFDLPDDMLCAVLFDLSDWRVVDYKYRDSDNRVIQRYDTIEAFTKNAANSVVSGDTARDFFSTISLQSMQKTFESGNRVLTFEYIRRMLDENEQWVREQVYLLTDPMNGHLCAFFTLHCLDDEPLHQAGEQNDLVKLLKQNVSISILCAIPQGEQLSLYYVNDSFLQLLGYDREEFIDKFGSDIQLMLRGEDIQLSKECVEGIVRTGRSDSINICVSRKDGTPLWLNNNIHYVRLPTGQNILYGIVTDITDIKEEQRCAEQLAMSLARQKDEITRIADNDVMTGILNREATMRYIAQYLQGEGVNGKHALFMIDIDNFKSINDTFGHQIGDKTLVDLAFALKNCFRDTDIVGRIGGDEFFALMKHANKDGIISRKAQEVVDAMQYICAYEQKKIELSASIGISIYEGDQKSLSAMYAEADTAMYNAKALGKNCFAISSELNEYAADTLSGSCLSVNSFSLRNLLNNIGGGIEIYHNLPDGKLIPVFFNESLLKILGGMTGDEFTQVYGYDAYAGVHPDEREGFVSAFMEARTRNAPFYYVYRTKGANDAYYWVSINANLVMHPDGSSDVYALYSDARRVISERAEIDKQFRMFQSYRQLAAKNTIASFRMNLTANTCSGGESTIENMLEHQKSGTVDGFFQSIYSCLLFEDDRQQYMSIFTRGQLLKQYADGKSTQSLVHRFMVRQGHTIWIKSIIQMLENPKTHEIEALIYAFDINTEKKMEMMLTKLINTDYKFLGLIDVKTGIMSVYGGENKTHEDRSFCDGKRYQEVIPAVFRNVINNEYCDEALNLLDINVIMDELSKHAVYTCSFPVKSFAQYKEGFCQWRCTYVDETKSTILMTTNDITDVISGERDNLAGIYNRQGFYRNVRRHIDANPDQQFKIVRFDIDNFKLLNDALGVEKGDKLLHDIGTALKQCDKINQSVCARLEADHFVMLINADGATDEELLNEIKRWADDYPLNYKISTHIGVYYIEDTDINVSIMCDRALIALKSIKNSYSQRIAYYDASLRSRMIEERELTREMNAALQQGQFEVYFQPQVNYDNGSLVGAEALVRWNHPVRGLLSPATFIPLFESNGFINMLDEYVWEKCCGYIRKWMNETNKYLPISVSVNISRLDIYNPDLSKTLKSLVERYNIPPSMLRLEITESVYMQNPDQLIRVVDELREYGFVIEMDDFGAGYSSLNTLKDVQVDILKLDIKFLSKGADDSRGGSILSSIIRMAHWLKMPVIAEGVETKTQADYLKSLSCFYMQGYYFDKPMTADNFEQLLLKSNISVADRYNSVNLDGVAAFWDPSAQIALLFNSFVGGAAIMEYCSGNAEILRANDMFYTQLNTTREAYLYHQQHMLSRFNDKNRAVFVEMLEKAASTGSEAECEVQSLPISEDSSELWTHNRVRILANNSESYLFYLATEDITKRKHMEEELRVNKEAMRLSISQMGRIVCNYDVATGVLTVPEDYAQKHGIPAVGKNIPDNLHRIVQEDREKYEAFYSSIRKGEEKGSLLFRSKNTDDTYSWEQMDFVTVFADDGAPRNAVITIQDFTSQMEQKEESARSSLLIERSGICVLSYDVVTDTLYYRTHIKDKGNLNLDIKRYLSYVNTNDSLVYPDDKNYVKEQLLNAVKGEPKSASFEYRANNWGTGYRWSRLDYISVGDEDGRVYRILGQIYDIQEQKENGELIKKLNKSLRIKDSEFVYNSTVVDRVFMLLYDTDASEETVNIVLAVLGEQYNLSRTYIFEDTADHQYCNNTFEWCAEGIESEKNNLQMVSYKDDLGGNYHANFNNSGVFLCRDISWLPQMQYKILAVQGIRSMLQCAINDNGIFSGYIGFDECEKAREWTDEQTGTLLLVSRIVGAFIMKIRKTEQAEFSEDFRKALDNNAQFMYIIEPETYRVVYSNKIIRDTFGQDYEGKICYREFVGRSTPCPQCPCLALKEGRISKGVEIQRPDGMLLLTQATPLHWNGRDLIMITCTDITEIITLRNAMQKQTASLEILYDTLPCGLLQYSVKDGALKLVSFNNGVWRILRYPDEQSYISQVGGEAGLKSVYPDDVPFVKEKIRLIINETSSADFEYRVLCRDGAILWVRALMQKISGQNGEDMVQTVVIDITYRKLNEIKMLCDSLANLFDEIYEMDYAAKTIVMRASKFNLSRNIGVGMPLEATLDRWCRQVVCWKDRQRVFDFFIRAQDYTERYKDEIQYNVINNGEEKRISAKRMCVYSNVFVVCNTDISARILDAGHGAADS